MAEKIEVASTKSPTATDHQARVSYFGQQVGIDMDDRKYLVLSKRRIIPAYTSMEKRDGPRRPERKMLHPSREVFDVFLTNREAVWKVEISYETHNLIRKRPGGRDETWSEDTFYSEVQRCIQYPFKNRFLIFKVKGGDEDDSTLTLDIRQKKGDIVTMYMQHCILHCLSPTEASAVLREALALEHAMICFYSKQGNLKRLRMYIDNGGDPNNVADGKWSALQLAAYGGHAEIVQYLVTERGVDMNVRSADKMDALFCATKGGHVDIFIMLHQAGARLISCNDEAEGEEGHLTYAVTCKQVDIARYINKPDGAMVSECNASHGVRSTEPPWRYFTTIDGGYPFSHLPKAQERRSKVRGGATGRKKGGAGGSSKRRK